MRSPQVSKVWQTRRLSSCEGQYLPKQNGYPKLTHYFRPQVSQLGIYIGALEKLNANLAFKGASNESAETVSQTIYVLSATSYIFSGKASGNWCKKAGPTVHEVRCGGFVWFSARPEFFG